MKDFYCNPLSLPHFQRGKACTGEKFAESWGWQNPDAPRDFREMADPTVICWENRWYLFPSCGMVWHSDDLLNWNFAPIEPFDIGYAPTVVEWRDQSGEKWLLLTASGNEMWRAHHPLGPWEPIGPVRNAGGHPAAWQDPCLFQDDDGALYCYNGIGPDGIYVVRLRDDNPAQWAGPRLHCFGFDPSHEWERAGDFNENAQKCMMEGAWMTKRGGRYFLQYSAPGTEWKTYAIGCYVGETPLGPWKYQARNPILRAQPGDFVNGCGHGSLVQGPNDPGGGATWWYFYTTLVRVEHAFERRIGMDAAGWDERGELFVNGPSQTPQWAPGLNSAPEQGNDAGMQPLSVNRFCRASTSAPGREAVWAFDNQIRSWWEAASNDRAPWLLVDLDREWEICASRVCFADPGLNYAAGIVPAPYRYVLEGSLDEREWFCVCDQSQNTQEKHICFDTWKPRPARWLRLRILEVPAGMSAAVWQWTVFGRDNL